MKRRRARATAEVQLVAGAALKIAGVGDEGCCGEPEDFRPRGRARKQEEEILKVREASPGHDDA